ncbi:MAG: ABC transporter permease [Muribaculaceae bacterium]|nr:ABC transporter permease [Muribaculaceae bacterium]
MMQTIKALAKSRIRYHKSRTLLTATAIMLTATLLMGLGTSAAGLLDVNKQQAKADGNVHAIFSGLNQRQIEMLGNHMDVEAVEVSELFATVEYGKMNGYLNVGKPIKEGIYHRLGNVIEGHEATLADEICGPKAFFERMDVEPVIGNKITISFRPYGKGAIQTREFTICGFVSQNDISRLDISDTHIVYSANVSEALAKEYLAEEEREYRANIRVYGEEELKFDEIMAKIETVAENIGYDKKNITINSQYLYTMTDPGTETIQIVGAIAFLVVFFAGMVIYSIYYVSVITDVQEIGKLKALGASRKQIKKLFLTEGMRITVFAMPLGLFLGYLLPALALPMIMRRLNEEIVTLARIGQIHMFSLPVLLLAAAAVLFTVYLSLLKPMRMAAKISPVEAMRYQESSQKGKLRKGSRSVNVFRLSVANLWQNKKRTIVTMLTMGLSSVLFICLAVVLGSMRAEDMARRNIRRDDFRLSMDFSQNDKEYPEKNLNFLQQQDLFGEALMTAIEEIDGVTGVKRDKQVLVGSEYPSEVFKDGSRVTMFCMDREQADEYQKVAARGTIDYDTLVKECGVMVATDIFFDEYGFSIGDMLPLTIYDGDRQIPFNVKIMGTVDIGVTGWFGLPEELWDSLDLEYDATTDLYIAAEKERYEEVKSALQEITDERDVFVLYSMDEEMRLGKMQVNLVKYPMYMILIMIAVISFMNLINTMITSIITRKRELGVLQAIGLSDRQLIKMLAGEGMVFTIGALTFSLTLGNLLGYLAYEWAKENHFMSLQSYHYPFVETILLSLVLILGQLGVTWFLAGRVRKESLIDRIRSGE